MTRIFAGGVPQPDELFGREHTIKIIWEHLSANNILLVAPRRFGKTGIMTHLLKRPMAEYLPVYLEVEDIDDPAAFCGHLIASVLEQSTLRTLVSGAKGMPKKVADFVSNRVKGFKAHEVTIELKDAGPDSWGDITSKLITGMEKADQTLLFIIDEFPQLIENIAKKHGDPTARQFLQWFRTLRLKQKDELRRYRFVLGGSTSIDIVLRRLDVPDKLNDFWRVPVEALTADHADALFNSICTAHELRFTADGRAAFFELITPAIPYFLHLFLSQIRMDPKLRELELGPVEVHDIYQRRVIGPACRQYFDYYRHRLGRYGEPARRAALAILQTAAHSPEGRVSNSALYDVYRKARGRKYSNFEFDEIMADLESDWYLVLDPRTNEHSFQIVVMRDWWKRFYRTVEGKRK